MSDVQPPTQEQLDSYVRTRLALAGFDLGLLPEQYDPDTGVPTRDQVLASLRSFVASTPGAISGWTPSADGPAYAQQTSPPLIYPSITEAWTGKAGTR
ncbi:MULTISPECIES: hypothetical protein [unclassified Streptomyces]|uniref:hypothetical protein n=1 Tax=unclassified Streptomyces TaxID=2593676 RepID=UPI002E8202EA|nr:hypothetical protein [Streptomyces sp. NBC_00589]WTI35373.1 hypothetical protein OIC96_10430 [Streptomyces sp. NBC_00775]WUB30953.1 hypothetical protein OHA51_39300 [Streptomyces sp. NBC_00589]